VRPLIPEQLAHSGSRALGDLTEKRLVLATGEQTLHLPVIVDMGNQQTPTCRPGQKLGERERIPGALGSIHTHDDRVARNVHGATP
jgi:hypothetical protein